MGLCFLQNNNNQDTTAAGFGYFSDLGSRLLILFYFIFISFSQLAALALLAQFSPQYGLVVHSVHLLLASALPVQTRARIS